MPCFFVQLENFFLEKFQQTVENFTYSKDYKDQLNSIQILF